MTGVYVGGGFESDATERLPESLLARAEVADELDRRGVTGKRGGPRSGPRCSSRTRSGRALSRRRNAASGSAPAPRGRTAVLVGPEANSSRGSSGSRKRKTPGLSGRSAVSLRRGGGAGRKARTRTRPRRLRLRWRSSSRWRLGLRSRRRSGTSGWSLCGSLERWRGGIGNVRRATGERAAGRGRHVDESRGDPASLQRRGGCRGHRGRGVASGSRSVDVR